MFFGLIKPQKIGFFYSGQKRILFRPEKGSFQKLQPMEILLKGISTWFWSKNRTFYHVCFLGKLNIKRSFFYILNKKECFLDQKNGVLVKSRKSTFSKGVSPLFLSKN